MMPTNAVRAGGSAMAFAFKSLMGRMKMTASCCLVNQQVQIMSSQLDAMQIEPVQLGIWRGLFLVLLCASFTQNQDLLA